VSAVRRLAKTSAAERARGVFARAEIGGRAPSTQPLAPVDPAAVSSAELERRRRDVARRLAEQHWDLGGLTYEMAVRDHFRLDVLQLQAARLQELDAELSQLERLARLDDAGAAGACPSCGSLYGRGSGFCSRCGAQLVDTVSPG